jgi:hypothetical protein
MLLAGCASAVADGDVGPTAAASTPGQNPNVGQINPLGSFAIAHTRLAMATGPMPVMISRSGRWPWRTTTLLARLGPKIGVPC